MMPNWTTTTFLASSFARFSVRILYAIACFVRISFHVRLQEMEVALPANQLVSRETLTHQADQLSHEVTKFVLFVSKDPSSEVIASQSEHLVNSIEAMIAYLRTVLAHAGPSLKSQVCHPSQWLLPNVSST